MSTIVDPNAVVEQTPAASVRPSSGRQVIVVCGAALGLACGFGVIFFSVIGLFLKPIAASFQWGRADVALLPMLGMAGVAVGAPVMGFIADRFGWRRVIGTSIGGFGLAMLALSVAPASHAYLAAVGFVLGAAGAATTAAGYLAILPRVFDRRFGMALGFGMLGSGVGGVVAPMLANQLLSVMDWRQAYAVLAGVALLVGAAAHQMIFRTLRGYFGLPGAPPVELSPAVVAEGYCFSEALGTYRFWLLASVIALVSGTILGGYVHLAAFASDRGMSSEFAARATALVGLGLAAARVAVGAVLDRVFAPAVAFVAFGLGAAGFAILASDPSGPPALMLVAALLLGVSQGAEGDLIPFLARKFFGTKAFGSIYGTLFGIATLGGGLGPYLYGLAYDRIKSYTPLHEISAVVCAACAVAILLLGRYPRASGRLN